MRDGRARAFGAMDGDDDDGYHFYGDDDDVGGGGGGLGAAGDGGARRRARDGGDDDDDDDLEPEAYGDGDDEFGGEDEVNLDEAYEPVDSDVMRLKRAWVQERLAPEILEHQTELVDAVKSAIETQEERIEREQENENRDASDNIVTNIYWMELNRVKYLLREYLRTRLRKMERHALFIFEDETSRAKLSSAELKYLEDYNNAVHEHLKGVLYELPEHYRSHVVQQIGNDDDDDKDQSMKPEPNLDGFVFFRIREDVGNFLPGGAMSEDDAVELKRGLILLAKYSAFKDLLDTDPPKAELV